MSAKRCKLIVAGEAAVGKTCIVNRAVNGIFTDCGPTTAAQFNRLEVKNSKGACIAFEIWDTAGQEKYRCLTKAFFQGAKAGILVLDLTNRKSLPAIEFYAEQIHTVSGPDTLLVLVGNKTDLQFQRQVTLYEGEETASNIRAQCYFECSAKTGEGIDAIVAYLGEHVTEFMEPKAGADDPAPGPVISFDKTRKGRKRKFC
jgi:small GTP-binding protein